MAFVPHIRITALGRIDGTPERFQYGVNMAGTGTLPFVTAAENEDTWADIASDVRAFHTRADSYISGKAVLEAVKIAQITEDGEYGRLGGGALAVTTVDVVDAPGGAVLPSTYILPQSALAISLVTDRYGPTGRGRFFIPMPCVALEADCKLSAYDAGAIRGSAATLLNDLNNQPGFDSSPAFRVVVASTKGTNSPVTGVRVGRAVDTVRSRRTGLSESYTTAAAVNN